jgi:hypothetical protein
MIDDETGNYCSYDSDNDKCASPLSACETLNLTSLDDCGGHRDKDGVRCTWK